LRKTNYVLPNDTLPRNRIAIQEQQTMQDRRRLLRHLAAIPFLSLVSSRFGFAESVFPNALGSRARRVRPTDVAWPSPSAWEALKAKVGGRLFAVESPLAVCRADARSPACEAVFKALKNPYYIGEEPALTQTSGWVDAWNSMPSVYAIAAETTADVVAGVNFVRENNLRLFFVHHGVGSEAWSPDGFTRLMDVGAKQTA
jgi:hypothetical protein